MFICSYKPHFQETLWPPKKIINDTILCLGNSPALLFIPSISPHPNESFNPNDLSQNDSANCKDTCPFLLSLYGQFVKKFYISLGTVENHSKKVQKTRHHWILLCTIKTWHVTGFLHNGWFDYNYYYFDKIKSM
jgi:hypothetical protein